MSLSGTTETSAYAASCNLQHPTAVDSITESVGPDSELSMSISAAQTPEIDRLTVILQPAPSNLQQLAVDTNS